MVRLIRVTGGLIATLLITCAYAAGDRCDVFTAEELDALHVPDPKIVTKASTVAGKMYETDGELPLTECTYMGSPRDSGRPPATNVFTVRMSMTELPSDAAERLRTKVRNETAGQPNGEISPGVTYDNDGEIECAFFTTPPLSMCVGLAGNIRLSLLIERYENEPANTSKVRKYFGIAAGRMKRGQ
jgi:hypothetical protein